MPRQNQRALPERFLSREKKRPLSAVYVTTALLTPYKHHHHITISLQWHFDTPAAPPHG